MIELKVMVTCLIACSFIALCAKYEEEHGEFNPWVQSVLGSVGVASLLGLPVSILWWVWAA